MSKRLMIVMGVVAAVVLGGAVAFAQTDGSEAARSSLSGTGFLRAAGSGSVDLEVNGTLRMAAEGDVVIVDRAGDARIRIAADGAGSGSGEALTRDTTYQLDGFQGLVHVAGSDFTVAVDGFSAFRARGEGTAGLVGEGVWKTRNDWGFWDEGSALSLEG